MESVGLRVGTFLWLVIHIFQLLSIKAVLIYFASSKVFLFSDFRATSSALGITVYNLDGFEIKCYFLLF